MILKIHVYTPLERLIFRIKWIDHNIHSMLGTVTTVGVSIPSEVMVTAVSHKYRIRRAYGITKNSSLGR